MAFEIHPQTCQVSPNCTVKGGRETKTIKLSDETIGNQRETTAKVEVTIFDVDERGRAEQIVAQAVHIIRKFTTRTPLGYLAPQSSIEGMREALEPIRARADEFNASARTCSVLMRPIVLNISMALGPEAIREIADHVREELTALRDALKSGDVNAARAMLLRSKRIKDLAIGPQGSAIAYAIEEGVTRLSEIKDRIKASESPESAGRSVDVSMIESAIGMFTPEAQITDSSAALASAV